MNLRRAIASLENDENLLNLQGDCGNSADVVQDTVVVPGLDEALSDVVEHTEALSETTELQTAMEDFMSAIPAGLAATEEVRVCRAISIGLEHVLKVHGISVWKMSPGLESRCDTVNELTSRITSLQSKLVVANESISEHLKKAWEWLIEKIKAMVAKVKEWLGIGGQQEVVLKRAESAVETIKACKDNAVPRKVVVESSSSGAAVEVVMPWGYMPHQTVIHIHDLEKHLRNKLVELDKAIDTIDKVNKILDDELPNIGSQAAGKKIHDICFPLKFDESNWIGAIPSFSGSGVNGDIYNPSIALPKVWEMHSSHMLMDYQQNESKKIHSIDQHVSVNSLYELANKLLDKMQSNFKHSKSLQTTAWKLVKDAENAHAVAYAQTKGEDATTENKMEAHKKYDALKCMQHRHIFIAHTAEFYDKMSQELYKEIAALKAIATAIS